MSNDETQNKTPDVKRGGQAGWSIRGHGEPLDMRPYVDQLEAENADLRRRVQALEEGKRSAIKKPDDETQTVPAAAANGNGHTKNGEMP